MSSFPYILLAGDWRRWMCWVRWPARSEVDGKRCSLSRAPRQLVEGCAERGSDKRREQRRERKQHFLQAILRTVSELFTSYFDTWSHQKHVPGPASKGACLSTLPAGSNCDKASGLLWAFFHSVWLLMDHVVNTVLCSWTDLLTRFKEPPPFRGVYPLA